MRRLIWVCVVASACAEPAPDRSSADTDAPGDSDTARSDTDSVVGDTDTPTQDTDVADTDTPVQASCVLGTGLATVTPLVSGGDATVVLGSQGRWHVYGAVHCTGIEGGGVSGSNEFADLSNPDNPVVDWQITDLSGARLAGYEGLHRPMATPDGAGMLGEYLVFWSGCYDTTVDTEAVMRFHLKDRSGEVVDLSVPVHLVAEPGYVADTDACP